MSTGLFASIETRRVIADCSKWPEWNKLYDLFSDCRDVKSDCEDISCVYLCWALLILMLELKHD